jgi:hypothetical protein
MDRRSFLKTTTLGTAGGGMVCGLARGAQDVGAAPKGPGATAPAVVARYTAEDHRRRLENIAHGHRRVGSCLRKHLVTNYLPAQCVYNLGEYPAEKPWSVEPHDVEELQRLRDHGIQLIQLFEEWVDPLRLFGGDKFTPARPAELRRFVDLAHQNGMRVIPYASTCFLDYRDPDFRPEWARQDDKCVVGWWNLARCSPASPGWRAYLLPRLARVLDVFGADGLYIDGGYLWNAVRSRLPENSPLRRPTPDEVQAFPETPEHDGAFTDLLALIYGEVKRRGGVFKLHISGADRPQSGGLKVYDYLWVGEGVRDAERMRQAVKGFAPYVVPCIDFSFAKMENPDEPYLHAIPYMQFPLLQAGKPYTGQRGLLPRFLARDNDFLVRRCREIWEHHRAHPNGPYSYGTWDAVPGRPETRPTHARWLKQYLPLVEEGTWAWLEVGQSTLFSRPLPEQVVASVFANRQLYLVLANYRREAVELETTDRYVDDRSAGAAGAQRWTLPQRSLAILRRTA